MPGWALNLVMGALAVAGLTVGALSYFRPRSTLRLCYQTTSVRYFDEGDYALPNAAVMTFEGQSVKMLTKATVVFWNAGSEVLRGGDMVQSDPIRLCVDEGSRLLSHEIIGSSKQANCVRAKLISGAQHELALEYDYLDAGDGFVVQVVHDGPQRDPSVAGLARGLARGVESRGRVQSGETRRPGHISDGLLFSPVLLVSLGLILLGMFMAMTLVVDASGAVESVFGQYFGPVSAGASAIYLGGGLVVGSLPAVVLWLSRRRYPRALRKYLSRPNR